MFVSRSATETSCQPEAERGTVPRAYQARASRVNGPSGRADRHAWRTRARCSPVNVVKYWPAGPTARVNGSQKSSNPLYSARAVSAPLVMFARPGG